VIASAPDDDGGEVFVAVAVTVGETRAPGSESVCVRPLPPLPPHATATVSRAAQIEIGRASRGKRRNDRASNGYEARLPARLVVRVTLITPRTVSSLLRRRLS